MPTAAFSRQLTLPLGRYAAWRNHQLGHVNLWSSDEWLLRLQRVGLDVVQILPYLRPALVRLWDALELLQLLWIGRRRLFGMVWHALPADALTRLAAWSGRLDLSSRPPGGGQLLIAEKGR